MPWKRVVPVVDHTVRALCPRPYEGHPHGCPNFGKVPRCPGQAPLIENVLELERPVWAIWNVFDLGAHVRTMQEKHPTWSHRQLVCCLYWQGTARKKLREEVVAFLLENYEDSPLFVVNTPEACGVNITATMDSIGCRLQWPPLSAAYQVVLAGTPMPKAREIW